MWLSKRKYTELKDSADRHESEILRLVTEVNKNRTMSVENHSYVIGQLVDCMATATSGRIAETVNVPHIDAGNITVPVPITEAVESLLKMWRVKVLPEQPQELVVETGHDRTGTS